MLQIINNTKAIRTFTYGIGEKLPLRPGANLVEEAVYEAVKAVPYQSKMFDKGFFGVKDAPTGDESVKPGTYIRDMSRIKKADAIKAIEACNDIHQLRDWQMQDGRDSIQKALYARYEVLRGDDPEEDEKDKE